MICFFVLLRFAGSRTVVHYTPPFSLFNPASSCPPLPYGWTVAIAVGPFLPNMYHYLIHSFSKIICNIPFISSRPCITTFQTVLDCRLSSVTYITRRYLIHRFLLRVIPPPPLPQPAQPLSIPRFLSPMSKPPVSTPSTIHSDAVEVQHMLDDNSQQIVTVDERTMVTQA